MAEVTRKNWAGWLLGWPLLGSILSMCFLFFPPAIGTLVLSPLSFFYGILLGAKASGERLFSGVVAIVSGLAIVLWILQVWAFKRIFNYPDGEIGTGGIIAGGVAALASALIMTIILRIQIVGKTRSPWKLSQFDALCLLSACFSGILALLPRANDSVLQMGVGDILRSWEALIVLIGMTIWQASVGLCLAHCLKGN